MNSARRARWSGVLVSTAGRSVLLRGTAGSVVAPAPEDAEAPDLAGVVLLESGDGLLLENGTDNLILEAS